MTVYNIYKRSANYKIRSFAIWSWLKRS